MNNEDFETLIDRLLLIEGEMNLLRDDKKTLLAEYKEKLDIKSVQAAMRIAKIRTKLAETSDEALEEMISSVEKKISV
tara:strand:- start:387 stop:620 length:234 start_codon:yes stop_codon:yes gene_type:complete